MIYDATVVNDVRVTNFVLILILMEYDLRFLISKQVKKSKQSLNPYSNGI